MQPRELRRRSRRRGRIRQLTFRGVLSLSQTGRGRFRDGSLVVPAKRSRAPRCFRFARWDEAWGRRLGATLGGRPLFRVRRLPCCSAASSPCERFRMSSIEKALAHIQALGRKFEGLLEAARAKGHGVAEKPAHGTALRERGAFGSNPGNLRMFVHVPERLPRLAPLVVALHGCGQTAADYDRGTGWSALADRLGFAVVFPEQQPA